MCKLNVYDTVWTLMAFSSYRKYSEKSVFSETTTSFNFSLFSRGGDIGPQNPELFKGKVQVLKDH